MKRWIWCAAISALLGAACSNGADSVNDTPVTADHTFASGGKIQMDLGGGSYEIRPGTADRIHVVTSGHTGDAKIDISGQGTSATVSVSNTPHSNFHAAIEVPKTTDLAIKLAAGNLTVAPITGDLDVDSRAGNVTITVADPNDYGNVDANVKAGDIKAGPFGESKSGINPRVTWSGPGKHTLHASVGAGNLTFQK